MTQAALGRIYLVLVIVGMLNQESTRVFVAVGAQPDWHRVVVAPVAVEAGGGGGHMTPTVAATARHPLMLVVGIAPSMTARTGGGLMELV